MCIDKHRSLEDSGQSQVFEGYCLTEKEDIVVKQIKLDMDGYDCLIKELRVQLIL